AYLASRGLLLGAAGQVGLDRDRQSAQVADVLADREGAVDAVVVVEVPGRERGVLGDQLRGARVERFAVLGRPPRDEVPVTVVLRALVVEAVAHLVADDRA